MSVDWSEEIAFSDAMSQGINAQGVVNAVQHAVAFEANACVITFTADTEDEIFFPRIVEKSIIIGANSGGAAITITD